MTLKYFFWERNHDRLQRKIRDGEIKNAANCTHKSRVTAARAARLSLGTWVYGQRAACRANLDYHLRLPPHAIACRHKSTCECVIMVTEDGRRTSIEQWVYDRTVGNCGGICACFATSHPTGRHNSGISTTVTTCHPLYMLPYMLVVVRSRKLSHKTIHGSPCAMHYD